MKAYKDIIEKVLSIGEHFPNRTGIDTIATFGVMFEHNMTTGFPLLTTKKMARKPIFVELVGFMRGITSKKWYQDRGCFIWDEWCNPQQLLKYDWSDLRKIVTDIHELVKLMESPPKKISESVDALINTSELTNDSVRKLVQLFEDDLGPIYGFQWRHFGKKHTTTDSDKVEWEGIDQLEKLINTMKTNPHDRRMIVTAWNPIEIENNTLALPPCHWSFEVYSNGKEFDLMWHQRSVDVFLGLPFNIASYSLLTHMIAQQCDLEVGDFVHTFGDCHLYLNHLTDDIVFEQLRRETRALPTLQIRRKPDSIFDYHYEDFVFENYDPHPVIKAPIAI
jgi:thymidylate synthase